VAETTWAEDAPSAPPKKSIPTWVWFCGAGCLAVIVLGVVAAIVGVAFFKNAMDPEKNWEKVALILPYDERPPELTPMLGMNIGIEQYQFVDSRGFQVTFQRHTGKDAAHARSQMFDTDHPKFPQNMGVMKFKDIQPATIDVQGRSLRVLRMEMELGGFLKAVVPKEGQEQFGAFMFADLTPEDADELLILQMMRTKGSGAISDDEVRTLLKPFHVGPKR
jgi:hypothetical protein